MYDELHIQVRLDELLTRFLNPVIDPRMKNTESTSLAKDAAPDMIQAACWLANSHRVWFVAFEREFMQ